MDTFSSKPLRSLKTGKAITPSVYLKEIFHEMRLEASKKLDLKKKNVKKLEYNVKLK